MSFGVGAAGVRPAVDKGFVSVAVAASECVTRLTSDKPPPWMDVLIQPQPGPGPLFVSSGELERVILEIAGKRVPRVVFSSLSVELQSMVSTVGTGLLVRGSVK